MLAMLSLGFDCDTSDFISLVILFVKDTVTKKFLTSLKDPSGSLAFFFFFN